MKFTISSLLAAAACALASPAMAGESSAAIDEIQPINFNLAEVSYQQPRSVMMMHAVYIIDAPQHDFEPVRIFIQLEPEWAESSRIDIGAGWTFNGGRLVYYRQFEHYAGRTIWT